MNMSSNAKIGVNPDVLEGKGSQTPPDFDGVSNLAEVPHIDRTRVDACHDRITQQPIEVSIMDGVVSNHSQLENDQLEEKKASYSPNGEPRKNLSTNYPRGYNVTHVNRPQGMKEVCSTKCGANGCKTCSELTETAFVKSSYSQRYFKVMSQESEHNTYEPMVWLSDRY
jgi:hypothetical protein